MGINYIMNPQIIKYEFYRNSGFKRESSLKEFSSFSTPRLLGDCAILLLNENERFKLYVKVFYKIKNGKVKPRFRVQTELFKIEDIVSLLDIGQYEYNFDNEEILYKNIIDFVESNFIVFFKDIMDFNILTHQKDELNDKISILYKEN